jgi:hypothetical protein
MTSYAPPAHNIFSSMHQQLPICSQVLGGVGITPQMTPEISREFGASRISCVPFVQFNIQF